MSRTSSPEASGPPPEPETLAEVTRISHKSYRRKYRKIMVKFEETMRESTSLFRDEQRILDLSRRLTEQNHQLLQLLSDLNSCPQIPPALRHDLSSSIPPEPQLSETEKSRERSIAIRSLRDARARIRRGEASLAEYHELESSVVNSSAFLPERSYVSLIQTPHTSTRSTQGLSQESGAAPVSGCLSAKEEELYIEGLDSFLDGKSSTPRPYAANSLGSRNQDRATDREKEMQLRNPVSVYNWLRKHQPQVFLQDNEGHSEKSAKPAPSRSSRRAPASSGPTKQEHELYDEDGIALEVGTSGRGKRKRDDDSVYRPKGGSSRPSKRKKGDGGTVHRRGKNSISTQ